MSTLITMAIVAGAGLYLWQKAHGSLKVTAVTVAVPQPPGTRCDVVVDVTGTIFTNGHGGPITYQWTFDRENLPVATVTDGSGQQSVRVDLQWGFHGTGTRQAVATLRVFTPNVVAAENAGFTYACSVMKDHRMRATGSQESAEQGLASQPARERRDDCERPGREVWRPHRR